MRSTTTLITSTVLLLVASTASARQVPESVKKLRDSIVAKGDCQKKLATGFKSRYDDASTASYCGDLLDTAGVIYQQMPGGQLVNMDIDCDGAQVGRLADDGRCGPSTDTQAQTSFRHVLQGYNAGVQDLNPFVHSYVVFGNEGGPSKPTWPTFDPSNAKLLGGKKVEPLSVMAVVCGDKMFYGVWGDENGPDGEAPVVGEASIGLATACFGQASINGNAGHDKNDVLYLAFTGADAVPGAKGAKWQAKTYEEFEQSLAAVGDALIERLAGSGGGNGNGTATTTTGSIPPPPTSTPTTSTTITTRPPPAPTGTGRPPRKGKGRGRGRKSSSGAAAPQPTAEAAAVPATPPPVPTPAPAPDAQEGRPDVQPFLARL